MAPTWEGVRPEIFRTFWYFASERQAMYERRLANGPGLPTNDPILGTYRFTNVFRAADRVSQYLIREVLPRTDDIDNLLYRVVLFRFFNRPDVWECIRGDLSNPDEVIAILNDLQAARVPLYNTAYITAPVPGYNGPKHIGHVRLAARLPYALPGLGAPRMPEAATPLESWYLWLRTHAGLGDFMAYQITIDLNYSPLFHSHEDEFVVPGPGARDGLSKMLPGWRDIRADIRRLTDEQDYWFNYYGLPWRGLFGRRLHLIDVQGLLCELSKYTRVSHAGVRGVADRFLIKRRYVPDPTPLPRPVFPARWGLQVGQL